MAYNEELSYRIKQALELFPDEFEEKKMFGGITFLYKGKMTVGVVKEDLVVRVIMDKHLNTFDLPFVRPMDFTKKALKDFIYVSKGGFDTEEQLLNWIELGLEHAKSKV